MTGLVVETKLSGLMLTNPKLWEKKAGLVVQEAVKLTAEMMRDAVIGDGGTLRQPQMLVFRNTLISSLKTLRPSGKWPKEVSVAFGSPHVHAIALEEGVKPGAKHPPIVATKTFSVPAKTHDVEAFERKGGIQVKAHKRTRKAHKASVKVSVLDAWIRNPRKMAKKDPDLKGESLDAYRARARAAYNIGEKRKRKGAKAHHYLARAVKKVGPKANKFMAKRISQGWADIK